LDSDSALGLKPSQEDEDNFGMFTNLECRKKTVLNLSVRIHASKMVQHQQNVRNVRNTLEVDIKIFLPNVL